jgi:phosphate transport system permease protein
VTLAAGAPAPRGRASRFVRRLRTGDEAAYLATFIVAIAVVLLTVLIAIELMRSSSLVRDRFGLRFLFSSTWDPVAEQFGAAPFVYGTLVTSGVALLIAVPLGVAVAIFLAELAPRRVSDLTALLVDLLAAVPSVIYGLIAISVLVPLMRDPIGPLLQRLSGGAVLFSGPSYGVGYLTAGLVLAIMIVPFIVSVSRAVLLAVPREQRDAALALGSTRWESTWRVVLPYARMGITGAVFLALGRALGETMAVTMVIGNRAEASASLLAPGYTMAAVIANEFTEATSDIHIHALVAIGLVLFLLTMLINAVARLLILLTTRRAVAA